MKRIANSSMSKISIIGAGDLGEQIANLAIRNGYEIAGYYDDYTPIGTKRLGGYVCGNVEDIYNHKESKSDGVIVAIGYKHFKERETLFEEISQKLQMATLIDRSAIIDESVRIWEGSVVMPGVTLDKGVTIGNNVFINVSSTIAHDSEIDDHSFIAPRVAIAGFTQIGRRSFIGINSTIIDNLSLCEDVAIGAGTVVVKSISESGLYVGNPARKIR